MKKIIVLLPFLFTLLPISAQSFEQYFCDSTLRLDYIFAGDFQKQDIYLDELSKSARWYGRKFRLKELPLEGNGSITVRDKESGIVIYRHSFSTLFQEWLATAEAKKTRKSFENVFLVPYPKQPVSITIELKDYHAQVMTSMTHEIDPKDILIRKMERKENAPYVTIQQAADTNCCIHIAYVAEGYTEDQMEQYLEDCRVATESLFLHEPFKQLRDRFHIIALCSPSHDTDVSQPGKNIWLNTALGSHFDTFYIERYLTTLHLKQLHDWLACTPYEHIIVLANTAHYGGGGIYNSYNLSYTRGDKFRPVVVHEFGHSFGGLGDEYPYGDEDPMYFADTEPWEPNLTTTTKKPAKWQNLIDPEFCPVCQQALTRLIDFYTVR